MPIVNGTHLIGALRVTYPTSFVDARIRRGWLVLVGIGLVALLVVFLVSLRLARQITVPVDLLVDATTRFGEGDLATRAAVPRGPPEIAQLTERFNDTAAQLERIVGSQREFVADASHQLRTPLAALRLRLENLESDVAADGDASADVAGALVEVGRLSRIVDGLLELARAERTAGGEPRPVAVGEVVRGRVDAWSAFADEHQVRFAVRVGRRCRGPLGAGAARAGAGQPRRQRDRRVAGRRHDHASRPTGPARRVVVSVADEGPGMTRGAARPRVRPVLAGGHGRRRRRGSASRSSTGSSTRTTAWCGSTRPPRGGLAVVVDLPAS